MATPVIARTIISSALRTSLMVYTHALCKLGSQASVSDKDRRFKFNIRKGIRLVKTPCFKENHAGTIKNLSNARTPPCGISQQKHHRLDAVIRQREGRCCRLRTATLTIGTLTGKGREVAAVLVARKIDILCLQELRWTGRQSGGKARPLGDGCKLYYCGEEG